MAIKFFENVKRIYQSLDFRFNKIYNVKTPDLTAESDGEEVANKNYVDDKTIFKSRINENFNEQNPQGKPIIEIVDMLMHEGVVSWKLPEIEFTDVYLMDNNFYKFDSEKINIFDSQLNSQIMISFNLRLNDFILSDRDVLTISNSYQQNVISSTHANFNTLALNKIQLSLDNIRIDSSENPLNTITFLARFFSAKDKQNSKGETETYNPKSEGEILSEDLSKFIFSRINVVCSPMYRILSQSEITGDNVFEIPVNTNDNQFTRYNGPILIDNIAATDKPIVIDFAVPQDKKVGMIIEDNKNKRPLVQQYLTEYDINNTLWRGSKASIDSVMYDIYRYKLGYFGKEISVKLYPL